MTKASKQIRVLHVLGKLGSGGVEKLLVSLLENIDRDIVCFDFLLASKNIKGFYDDYVTELGSKIYYMNFEENDSKITRKRRLYSALKKYPYDIVHFHGTDPAIYLNALIARLAGVKNVIIHAHSITSWSSFRIHILPLIKSFFGWAPTYFLACSPEAAEYMWPKNTKASNSCVLLNGIDLNAYAFSQEKRKIFRKQNGLENKFVIGHIGRLSKLKNHEFLIKVFSEIAKKIPNSVLLLIGEGEEKLYIQNMVSDLKLEEKVIFYGTTKDIPSALMGMDVMCFPSLKEGVGIVAIEAQAASLPVVASDGVPDSANVSKYFYKLNLSAPVNDWADLICSLSEKNERIADTKDVEESGYDIKNSAKKIMEIYRSMSNS